MLFIAAIAVKKCNVAVQIHPQVHHDELTASIAETMPELLDTSLTPATIKKLSKSVLDLPSTLGDMKELSKSTSHLSSAGMKEKFKLKKLKKQVKGGKSESKTSLIGSETTSTVELESLQEQDEIELDEDEIKAEVETFQSGDGNENKRVFMYGSQEVVKLLILN